MLKALGSIPRSESFKKGAKEPTEPSVMVQHVGGGEDHEELGVILSYTLI